MPNISDYPTPIIVNGYGCNTSKDVDYAMRFIDPANPKAGPFGVDAMPDPAKAQAPVVKPSGGATGATATHEAAMVQPKAPAPDVGAKIDTLV